MPDDAGIRTKKRQLHRMKDVLTVAGCMRSMINMNDMR